MSGGEHSMLVSIDRTSLQKSFKEVLRSKKAAALHYVTSPIQLLRIVSELGEAGTRLGEMRRGLDAMADPVEVAFSSREVTLDFLRIGASAKSMNIITAFFNAGLEGTDRMVRAFKDNPGRSTWKSMISITLPSILLYFANRNDPRWKEIPQWQKDIFWIVLTPEHIYRIPKPFLLGILFGSVPERVLEYIDTEDPEAFNSLFDTVVKGITPNLIPTAALPIMENYSNHSYFLDRPIVGRGEQDLIKSQQFGQYTSELSKIIGGVINRSPAKIDNLIQGYTAGLGNYTVSAIDKALVGTGIVNPPPEPTRGIEDAPVIKSFMIRPPIGSGSESVNKVYELNTQFSAEQKYHESLLVNGEIEKADAYLKDNPTLHLSSILSSAVSNFSDLNKTINQIRASRNMTPDDKKGRIDNLKTTQTTIAKEVLRVYNNTLK